MSGAIYFVEDQRGLIKIGFTTNLKTRLGHIRGLVPVSLLGSVAAERWHERAIHRKLAEHRAHGEWFAGAPDVRELIRAALQSGVDALDLQFDERRGPKDDYYARLIAAEAQKIVFEAAQPIAPGEGVGAQMERAWNALGQPPFWRLRAAWHGVAGVWSAVALEDMRARDKARRSADGGRR